LQPLLTRSRLSVVKAFLRVCAVTFPIVLGLQVVAGVLEELRAKAEQGDAEAQCDIGTAYLDGVGVPKDSADAVEGQRRVALEMTGAQIVEGLRLVREFKPQRTALPEEE